MLLGVGKNDPRRKEVEECGCQAGCRKTWDMSAVTNLGVNLCLRLGHDKP